MVIGVTLQPQSHAIDRIRTRSWSTALVMWFASAIGCCRLHCLSAEVIDPGPSSLSEIGQYLTLLPA
jgi:hypothetical protein